MPIPSPVSHPVKPTKRKGDIDTLNALKGVAGLLPGLIAELESEATDTRVPVSEALFAELLTRVKPGVTLRGLVSDALTAFLAGTRLDCSCHSASKADPTRMIRVMFELNPSCRGCRKVMTHAGRREDRPTLAQTDDGPQLLCGECSDWIRWNAEGGDA